MSKEELGAVFAQQGYRCKLEWGRQSAREAARRGDILVVVDVLSFSSAVITAAARGASIKPCVNEEAARREAAAQGGIVAVKRADAPRKDCYSLSPPSFLEIPARTRVFLPSPNGAACIAYALEAQCPRVFVGALLNAKAVGQTVAPLLSASEYAVTVLACGERWQIAREDGALRFALEDYLGAGAVLSALRQAAPSADTLTFSPESQVCRGAFETARADLVSLLWECGSGRELRERGYAGDVTHSARLDAYHVVPCADADGWLSAEL